jgi:hypothetical protein
MLVSIQHDLADTLAQNSDVRTALRKFGVTERRKSKIADSPSVHEIGKSFIVLVSPLAFPNVAANEARAINSVRQLLPSHLSLFTIPLSQNRLIFELQKRRIKPVIFDWLRGLVNRAAAPSDETSAEFQASLEGLARLNNLPGGISSAARDGLARLSKGSFVPRHCPMHGDLWKGNIIYSRDKSIKVIDWRGYRIDGYGLFDLVKFAHTFKIKAKDFRSEVQIHAQSLGIDMIDARDARTTLLASCGYISRNLGEFPFENFVAMTSSLCNYFEALI